MNNVSASVFPKVIDDLTNGDGINDQLTLT